MGIRASSTTQLYFDCCWVPDNRVIGKVGEGFRIAMKTLDYSRPGVAAQALGIAQGDVYKRQFRDYVLALKEWEKTDTYKADKMYWQKKVIEIAPAPQLPLARQPQDVSSNRFARVQTVLSQTEWDNIKQRAKKYGCLLYTSRCV